jgi:transposase
VTRTRIAALYQEDLPIVQPIVRRFDLHVGHHTQCERRVQARHPLQTTDAFGAAAVHLGPPPVALISILNKHLGLSHAKIATLLRERFGLTVSRAP